MEGQSRDGEAIVFLLFSDIFVGRDKALMEGDKVMMVLIMLLRIFYFILSL